MAITDKILEILNALASGNDPLVKTVIHANAFDSNVRLDRNETPAAILYMIEGWSVDVSTAFKRKSVDIEVFFCDRYQLNAKGEVIQQVLDTVEPICDEFISLVLSERSWEVSEIKASAAYGKFDCNVCGYSLQMKLTEKQGQCL